MPVPTPLDAYSLHALAYFAQRPGVEYCASDLAHKSVLRGALDLLDYGYVMRRVICAPNDPESMSLYSITPAGETFFAQLIHYASLAHLNRPVISEEAHL
jgi:hypothetical protein